MADSDGTQKSHGLDEDLFKAVDAFGESVLIRLREKAEAFGIPKITQISEVFPHVGAPRAQAREQIIWHEFAGELFSAVEPLLPEVEHLGRLVFDRGLNPMMMLSDAKGAPIAMPTFDQAGSFFVPSELFGIIISYVEDHGSLEHHVANFREHFQRYLNAWQLSTIPQRVSVPLLRFSAQPTGIAVWDRFRIEPLEGPLKTESWQRLGWERMGFRPADFEAARFHITGILETPRAELVKDVTSGLSRKANFAVTALRLLHAGHVAAPSGCMGTISPAPQISLYARWGNFRVPECEPSTGGPEHVFRESDGPQFEIIFHRLVSLDERGVTLRMRTMDAAAKAAQRPGVLRLDDHTVEARVGRQADVVKWLLGTGLDMTPRSPRAGKLA